MGGRNKAADDQAKRMKEETARANAEKAKIAAENERKSNADKRRRMGRSLLITNAGGELGIDENLG